jgi:hypothetical protein
MVKRFAALGGSLATTVLVATLVLGVRPVAANHDPDISADEFLCQYKTTILNWKFFAKKGVCVLGCQRKARAAQEDPADCVPPYAGAAQGCINGAEGKAQAGMCKACTNDLPECYGSPQNCPDLAAGFAATMESELDDLMADVYCDDSGSGDGLTAAEALCQDVVAKTLAGFAYKKAKCLAKCHAYEHKGKIPVGSCVPGAITDPTLRTQGCITKTTMSANTKIDKGCSPSFGRDAAECHGGQTAQQWTDGVEVTVDDEDPNFFCGSPSGAFLD